MIVGYYEYVNIRENQNIKINLFLLIFDLFITQNFYIHT